MRAAVDRFFSDTWMMTTYMGQVVDLTVLWSVYPAARSALENIAAPENAAKLEAKNAKEMGAVLQKIEAVLKEGVLTTDYFVDNLSELVDLTRRANHSLRWRLLQRRSRKPEIQEIIGCSIIGSERSPTDASASGVDGSQVFNLLLQVAQFELAIKTMFQQLLENKDKAWIDGKDQVAEHLLEVSEAYRGGQKGWGKVGIFLSLIEFVWV